MQSRFFLSCCAAAGILMSTLAYAAEIQGSIDRQNGLYQCGETATFQFKAIGDDKKPITQGEMTLVLSNDGGKVFEVKKVNLAKDPNPKMSGTMKTPGFLRCQANMNIDKKVVWKAEGAGYEVEKIKPAAEAPADFNQFWADAVKKAEAIPLDAQVEKLEKYSNDKYTSYKVSFAAPGGRVYGFLCIPAGKGPFPALVDVPGAGPGVGAPAVNYAARGIAFLIMNVHPYNPLNGKELYAQYNELNKRGIYSHHDSNDREKYFYYRAILGINRAVNWLAQRSDIDTKRIGYFGSSQGGAFGLILGGLNPHIAAIVANVPAMCDHYGHQADRGPGWPRLVRPNDANIVKTAGYYDAVNFARNIKCPTRIIVGFGDTTCSPSSVYAAYSVLKSDKKMTDEIGMGHAARPSYTRDINWMIDYLTKK